MTSTALVTVVAMVWLTSCGSSLVGLYYTFCAKQRPWVALGASAIALVVGYFGWARIQLSASRVVNGQVQWSFDSYWFFIAAMVLGGATLALTVMKWKKPESLNRAES